MNNLKLKLLASDSACETKFRSRVTSSDAQYMILAQILPVFAVFSHVNPSQATQLHTS